MQATRRMLILEGSERPALPFLAEKRVKLGASKDETAKLAVSTHLFLPGSCNGVGR